MKMQLLCHCEVHKQLLRRPLVNAQSRGIVVCAALDSQVHIALVAYTPVEKRAQGNRLSLIVSHLL